MRGLRVLGMYQTLLTTTIFSVQRVPILQTVCIVERFWALCDLKLSMQLQAERSDLSSFRLGINQHFHMSEGVFLEDSFAVITVLTAKSEYLLRQLVIALFKIMHIGYTVFYVWHGVKLNGACHT